MSLKFTAQINTVSELEELIGYTFNNKLVAWEALQTKGCGGFVDGNKRLALLGDAVLKMEVLKKWYFTSLSRGMLFTSSSERDEARRIR